MSSSASPRSSAASRICRCGWRLSAALPVTWSPLLVYFGITLILALLDWPSLGRAVRSKLLSLREEDYAVAAQLMGAKPRRIIGRHLLPGFMSHLIASATLSIPSMILAETALSFLGLGLRPPITSWGVLLNEAHRHQRRGGELVADAAGGAGDPGHPRLPVHGRRHARRRRSLRLKPAARPRKPERRSREHMLGFAARCGVPSAGSETA